MTTPVARSRTAFLGLLFEQANQRDALDIVAALSQVNGFEYVVTPNVDHLVRLHSAEAPSELWKAYGEAALCLCDSKVLKILARLSGTTLTVTPGSDLTVSLLEHDLKRYPHIAVIGGDKQMFETLKRTYSACQWHQHIPPMGIMNDSSAQDQICKFVEQSCANLYLFAIGSPQSEIICKRIKARGNAAGVGLCIGASLEFVTGTKSRAPLWMRKYALEWLYRLSQEPSRLSRRYLIDGPKIFRIWWRYRSAMLRHPAECDSSRSGGP